VKPTKPAFAALAIALIACGTSVEPAAPTVQTGPSGPESSPTGAPPEASPTPEPTVFETSDPAGDCFDGFRAATECAGVDLVGLLVAPAGVVPEAAGEVSSEGRLVFAFDFAEDLAAVEEFGIFLYFDLDRDPSTGVHRTDLPGVERLIGGSPPTTDTWTQDLTAGDYDAEIVRDDALVTLRVQGSRLLFLVAPSLLADAPEADPDGFRLYVITARSITNEDSLNGEELIHTPAALDVPDEVVTQPR